MSVCSDMHRDMDISSISSDITHSVASNIDDVQLEDDDVFKWSTNCFICTKRLKTGKGKSKSVQIRKITKKSDVRETILNICKNRSDDLANTVSMRIAPVDLYEIRAGFHEKCLLLFTKARESILKNKQLISLSQQLMMKSTKKTLSRPRKRPNMCGYWKCRLYSGINTRSCEYDQS